MTDSRSLLDMRRGTRGTILTLPPNAELRSQCIRLGLIVGANCTCLERLPGGTIVLETNRQEIALGNALAREITIAVSDAEGTRPHDHTQTR